MLNTESVGDMGTFVNRLINTRDLKPLWTVSISLFSRIDGMLPLITCFFLLNIIFCNTSKVPAQKQTSHPARKNLIGLGYPNEPVEESMGIKWGTDLDTLRDNIPTLMEYPDRNYYYSNDIAEISGMSFLVLYRFCENKLCEIVVEEIGGAITPAFLEEKYGECHEINHNNIDYYWYGKKVDIEFTAGFEHRIKYTCKPLARTSACPA